MKQERKAQANKPSWIRILLSLLVLPAVLLEQGIAQLAGQLLRQVGLPADLCVLAAALCCGLMVWLTVRLLCGQILGLMPADCRMAAPRFRALWCVVAFALPGFVCIALINLPGYWQINFLSTDELGAVLFSALFYQGLTAGIVQEAVFRGMLLSAFERGINRLAGILLNSALFSVVQLIGQQLTVAQAVQLLVFYMLLGLLFSLVTVETGNIWNAALMHSVWGAAISGGVLHIGTSANPAALANYLLADSGDLLTGGSAGAAASVLAIVACTVFVALAFWRCHMKKLI